MEQKQLDFIAWQQRMYIRLAVASILDSDINYPKRPMSYKNESENKDNSEYIKMRMMEQMINVNKRFESEMIG